MRAALINVASLGQVPYIGLDYVRMMIVLTAYYPVGILGVCDVGDATAM